MNSEKILKKKIQQYLLMPLALTVLLVGMVIVLYVHDKKSGAIAAAAVFLYTKFCFNYKILSLWLVYISVFRQV